MGLSPESRRLWRLVSSIVAGGLLLQAAVAALLNGHGPIAASHLPGPLAGGVLLVLGLLLLTVAAEMTAVPVRHGDEIEELTLVEAAVLINILLLPAHLALLVPVAASLLTSVLRRRNLVKTFFNAGNLAAATAVLVLAAHLTSTGDETLTPFTPLAVLGLVVGTLGFVAVNLTALALVLSVLGEAEPWQVVRQGARMSAVMAVSTVGLCCTTVVLATNAPTLLPFSLVPAVALTFAFRAAAQEAEERARSTKLLALSHVLAEHLEADELTAAFLRLSREAFGAHLAFTVSSTPGQPNGSIPMTTMDSMDGPEPARAASATELQLVRTTQAGGTIVTEGLPDGWGCVLLAPLEADDHSMGTLVMVAKFRKGWSHRWATRTLGPREQVVLTPLASALANALQGVAHLHRLTEESSKLQAVIDQSSDGILVLDDEGVVQIWSPALAVISGRDEQTALGYPLGSVLRASTPAGLACHPFAVAREQLSPQEPSSTLELLIARDEGEPRVVRWAHSGVFEGPSGEERLVRLVVIVHDVTRERQVDRLKADFIATVSHELRTPITPIKGYADLLLNRSAQMTPEQRTASLNVIVDRADHLARLVEDLLLASRISATSASVTPVNMVDGDLVTLVQRACADPGEEGLRLRLHLPDGPVPVSLDPVRALQVVTNLVGNARKYSAPGTPVDITVRVLNGEALVEVVDQGRGIPADQLERVFEKFHRVEDPMTMTTSGTGLGLYIARDLAGAMGGRLTCTSVVGTGSTFVFVLPLLTEATAAAVPVAAVPVAVVPVAAVPAARVPAALHPAAVDPGAPPAGPGTRVRRAPPWAATPPPKPQPAPA